MLARMIGKDNENVGEVVAEVKRFLYQTPTYDCYSSSHYHRGDCVHLHMERSVTHE